MPKILYNQKETFAHLTTTFGDSDIILKSLVGTEAISELFCFEIVFSAKSDSLDLEKALESSVNIAFKSDTQERYIDGIITEFSQGATANKGDIYVTEYSAIIRPSFWLLTLDRNNLIFQSKSAIDIIKQVLKDGGVKDVEDKTSSCGKVVREYCVQYGESSFNFVSRLMEDEGIFYFFKHEKNKHTLVLADGASAHAKPSGESKIKFFKGVSDTAPLGIMFNARMTTSVNTGGYSISDYNYTLSQTSLFSKLDSQYKGQMFYEYPGKILKLKEGEDLSKLRVQLFEFNHCLFSASSTAPSLTPGFTFEVADHYVSDFNKEYVVYELRHSYSFDPSSGFTYVNEIRAFKKGTEFRPLRKTPKPHIFGTQTAVVTCPSGKEIYRNEHCCVKIHFYWDQKGTKDEKSSCWVRVAQSLAGSGWGGVFIPRIGQEVIVTFIEGDPDNPLIVGCVYNDKFMPPYADDQAMISTLKTVTFTDEEGFNELRFNDEKDKEEIYFHARKDVTWEIQNGSRSITILSENGAVTNSFSMKEGDDLFTIEKGNSTKLLKEGDQIFTQEKGNFTETQKEGNRTATLEKGNYLITLSDGNLTYNITGDCTITITGKLTIKADDDVSIESGKNVTMKAGQNFTIEAGQALSLKGGTDLKGEAGTALTLKSGTDFKATSGTAMALDAGMNLEAKAKMNIQASATMKMELKANMTFEANGQISAKLAGTMAEVAGTGMAKVGAPMITVGGGMLQLG